MAVKVEKFSWFTDAIVHVDHGMIRFSKIDPDENHLHVDPYSLYVSDRANDNYAEIRLTEEQMLDIIEAAGRAFAQYHPLNFKFSDWYNDQLSREPSR